jgi:hypothetical protein
MTADDHTWSPSQARSERLDDRQAPRSPSVDVTAADAVCELDETLRAVDIELRFAEMKDAVKGQAEALRSLHAL